ncbi:MAG TPA: condensation domain-containing protein, partial [Thermoanaerobaculia bacterium]|nr:condensation domain-containing protein [Thermoanaerobaculia bacterium]
AVGELCIGGDGLARGYLNRPELTAERFIPHPWERGERLYRTGDLVRQRPDGVVEYLGRLDHQVKIRGFRIELGEIEAVLAGHPQVHACAVLARRDTGETRLAAYVAGRDGQQPDAAGLRRHLQERLPEYMIPSAFVVLDELPLTANGKVDRKALPAPERAAAAATATALASPADPVQELLAGLWAEVLALDRVGAHDDFFELGGHSLLATRVVSRIRETLGVELPLPALFEAPTVEGVAQAIREIRQDGAPQAPPVLPVPREDGMPLSFAQQRLWFIDQLEPGNAVYNIPTAVRLAGEVAPDLLARIFAEVVRRHEVLRTTFRSSGGQPVQEIAAALEPELAVLDLSHLEPARREARAREIALEAAGQPFDLQRGPLLRLALVRLAERDHLLLVTLHHIVSDGWSMGLLLREIAALYEAFSQGRPSPLPELPVQYADFAVWQREWLRGEVLDAQLAYWKRQLDGAPRVLELPTDHPRPPGQTYGGASRPLELAPELSAAVRDLCRREGVTPFIVLLAAWATLLARHAGQDEVLVGSPIAGRNRREIEDLIGFFVNTVVLRSDLSGAPAFGELLARLRSAALDAHVHQDLPFERLVEELVPERDLSRSPLFQAMFAFQNAPGSRLTVPGLAFSTVALESRVAKFDLQLSMWEGPDRSVDVFAGVLEHNTDLFDAATMERLLARFQALWEAAAADPETPVTDLPLLLAADRRQLLEWNGPGAALLAGPCLHELFFAQAARTPGAVAVLHGDGPVTYAGLAARARGFAHRL